MAIKFLYQWTMNPSFFRKGILMHSLEKQQFTPEICLCDIVSTSLSIHVFERDEKRYGKWNYDLKFINLNR